MNDQKSELEQHVELGAFGAPELKRSEKNRYLGEFRERVIKALTVEQVEEPGVYPEIMDALKDSRAKKLILRRDVEMNRAKDYIELARHQGVAFKRVDSPKLKGEIGLVIVSDDAVDEPVIEVMTREEKMLALGLSKELVYAVDAKLCAKCWKQIESLCPEELINYQRISWIESITGIKCLACSSDR